MYIFKNEGDLASVVYDESTLTAEQKKKGKQFDELPVKEQIEGKDAYLKFDGTTVWWEYVDIQPDRIEELEKVVADLTEIVLGGM